MTRHVPPRVADVFPNNYEWFCTRIWNNVRLAGGWQFVRFGSRNRRRCGNVGTRVLCGFPSSEGRPNRWSKRSIIPPSERHFHSEAPFIGRSGGNLVFGGRRSGMLPFKKPPRMNVFPDSRSEPYELSQDKRDVYERSCDGALR